MNQCLRESRFDVRGNQSSDTDSTLRVNILMINFISKYFIDFTKIKIKKSIVESHLSSNT